MTKKIIIVVATLIIFTLIVVSLIVCSYFKKSNTDGSTSSNGNKVVANIVEQDIPTPEGYTKVDKSNITSKTSCVAEGVFFKEIKDGDKDKTLVRVHLLNKGENVFDKNSVCTISLFDSNDNLLHRIGGVIESSSNIAVGGRTIIDTQFYGKAGAIAKAEIDF